MATLLPNGVTGKFEACKDNLQAINDNFVLLDSLISPCLEQATELPASPFEGQTIVINDGMDNNIHVFVCGEWKTYQAKEGMLYFDKFSGNMLFFDGSGWVEKLLNDPTLLPLFTNAGNIGTGSGIFAGVNAGILEFKSIVAGDCVTVTDNGQEIELTIEAVKGGLNLGTGEIVYVQKNADGELEFKTFVAGTGIDITSSADEIMISLEDQVTPVNWYPDPKSNDPSQLYTTTATTFASAPDDVFYNSTNLYEATGSTTDINTFPFSENQEICFKAPVQSLFVDECDPCPRVFISFDIEFDDNPDASTNGFSNYDITLNQLSGAVVLATQTTSANNAVGSAVNPAIYRFRQMIDLNTSTTDIEICINQSLTAEFQ